MQAQPTEPKQCRIPPLDYRMRMFVKLTALRMIQVTINDLASPDMERQLIGLQFIFSGLFNETCDWADLDRNWAMKQIAERARGR